MKKKCYLNNNLFHLKPGFKREIKINNNVCVASPELMLHYSNKLITLLLREAFLINKSHGNNLNFKETEKKNIGGYKK